MLKKSTDKLYTMISTEDYSKSDYIWYILPTILLAGLIYLSDIGTLVASLASPNLKILPSIGFGISVMFVFAYTWYRFLNKVGIETNYRESLQLFYAGQFLNSVTPLGQFGGEPAMAYIIKKHKEVEYHKAFCIVFSADILNAIPAFTFIIGGGLYLIFFGTLPTKINYMIITGGLIGIFGGLLTYILWFKSEIIEKKIIGILDLVIEKTGRGDSIRDKFKKKVDGIQETLAEVGESPKHLTKTALVAHLSFLLSFGALILILESLNVQADLTKLYFIITLSGIAEFTPTPGGAGAYEAAMTGLLTTLTGIPLNTAATISILYRIATYWPNLLIGYTSILILRTQRN